MGRRLPHRAVVLVDDQGPNAFEKIVVGTESLGETEFHGQHFVQAHGRAAPQLFQRDFQRSWRLGRHGFGPFLRVVALVGEQGVEDLLHRLARKQAVDLRLQAGDLGRRRLVRKDVEHAHDRFARGPRVEVAQQFGGIVQPLLRDVDVGETDSAAIRAVQTAAGQRQIPAEPPRQPRQEPAAANVWEETDASLRHGEHGILGRDTHAAQHRHTDAAAHDDAVHEGDVGLGIVVDAPVDDVLVPEERGGVGLAALAIQPLDIAAHRRADQDAADFAVRGPVDQLPVHGVEHLQRQRV